MDKTSARLLKSSSLPLDSDSCGAEFEKNEYNLYESLDVLKETINTQIKNIDDKCSLSFQERKQLFNNTNKSIVSPTRTPTTKTSPRQLSLTLAESRNNNDNNNNNIRKTSKINSILSNINIENEFWMNENVQYDLFKSKKPSNVKTFFGGQVFDGDLESFAYVLLVNDTSNNEDENLKIEFIGAGVQLEKSTIVDYSQKASKRNKFSLKVNFSECHDIHEYPAYESMVDEEEIELEFL
jgi:hypothetical protein